MIGIDIGVVIGLCGLNVVVEGEGVDGLLCFDGKDFIQGCV